MLSAPVERAASFADRVAAGLPAGSPEALVGQIRTVASVCFQALRSDLGGPAATRLELELISAQITERRRSVQS